MIAIIDVNYGNQRSVLNAFTAIGADVRLTRDHADLRNARALVLPGVGAFADGMAALDRYDLIDLLRREVMDAGKPFLGICVGLQLLATIGLEHGETPGLGWIPGSVLPLDVGKQPLRVPHVGWNDVRFLRTDGLYAGMGEKAAFYFVHSYALRPEHPTVISGVTNYGEDFTASLESGNIAATQFHPEKSHHTGLKLLENWRKRALSC